MTELFHVMFSPSIKPKDRRLVMLSAYLDECELRPLGVFAIAGYVLNGSDCERFEEQWLKALNSTRPPLERFHMSEFENRKGPYASWGDKFRHHFLNRLISIMSTNNQLLIGAALDLGAFASLNEEERRLLNAPTPYRFCFEICMANVIAWLKEQGQVAPVAYVLDMVKERDKGKGTLQKEFVRVSRSTELSDFYRMESLNWRDNRKVPELQAADFAVYELAKEAAHKVGRSDREPRKSAMLLLRDTTDANRKATMIDRAYMDELLVHARK